MSLTTIFFDLDDTLYPSSSGLWPAIKQRMNDYMRDRVGIPEHDIAALRERYFMEFGTTLRGLEARHGVDVPDFLAYVHHLPLDRYLAPDPVQRSVILSLNARRFIFTNSDAAHAARVLNVLDLSDCFDGIVDVNALAPFCKPMPDAFRIAMQRAGETEPRRCAMIDDLPRTTLAARQQGMIAVLFGQDAPHPDADVTICSWADLPAALARAPGGQLANA